MSQYDVIVVGAGPGGYVCALRAAQLGQKVALVEAQALGGTCLNMGCIPTKTLLHEAAKGEGFSAMHARRDEVTASQRAGIEALMKAGGVTVFYDRAQIEAGPAVRLAGDGMRLTGKAVVVATGAVPAIPPIPGADAPGVVTSDDLLRHTPELPKDLLIIGGGVIGVEMASLYAAQGVRVTLIEALPRLLANMDKEIGQSLAMQFKKDGITVVTGAAVQHIAESDDGLRVTYDHKGKTVEVMADQVLIATGRRPATADLFAADATPEMDRGQIKVGADFATSLPGLYGIGDVRGGIQLAHHASAQGKALAEILAGKTPEQRLDIIPSCVYTQPEIATVGLDAQQAKEAGIDVIIGKFGMGGNAKTVIDDVGRSFIKLVFRADDHALIGAQMLCGRASDLIAVAVVAMSAGMTAEQLAASVFPHPTYSEGIGEAAEAALGACVHVIKR